MQLIQCAVFNALSARLRHKAVSTGASFVGQARLPLNGTRPGPPQGASLNGEVGGELSVFYVLVLRERQLSLLAIFRSTWGAVKLLGAAWVLAGGGWLAVLWSPPPCPRRGNGCFLLSCAGWRGTPALPVDWAGVAQVVAGVSALVAAIAASSAPSAL